MFSSGNRRGGALAGVLIGLAVLFALVLITVVGFGIYLAGNVHVKQANGNTVVETPIGSMRVRGNARFTPAQFGVPIYPGAVLDGDHRKLANVDFDLGDEHHEFSIVAAHYSTGDPSGKVVAFYREKLPEWTVIEKADRPWKHGDCRFEFHGSGFKRVVVIRAEGGTTHIALASIGEPAAN
jgi:hypothetical protein